MRIADSRACPSAGLACAAGVPKPSTTTSASRTRLIACHALDVLDATQPPVLRAMAAYPVHGGLCVAHDANAMQPPCVARNGHLPHARQLHPSPAFACVLHDADRLARAQRPHHDA